MRAFMSRVHPPSSALHAEWLDHPDFGRFADQAVTEARRILAEAEPCSENANHYALPCAIGWPVGLPYTKSMTGGPLWKHVVANRSANCGTYVILEPGDDTEALADALRAFVEGD